MPTITSSDLDAAFASDPVFSSLTRDYALDVHQHFASVGIEANTPRIHAAEILRRLVHPLYAKIPAGATRINWQLVDAEKDFPGQRFAPPSFRGDVCVFLVKFE